jgi:hypothetical protein
MMRAWTAGIAAVLSGSLALLVPGGAASAAETVEHAVRAGDNLHLIAGYYYRDPRQWSRIWKLNRASVPRPSQLVPGRVVRVEVNPGQGWEIPYEEFRARVRGK